MNKEKCKEWAKDRLSPSPRNPLTNRNIKENGPKYKELDKDCKDLIVDLNSVCRNWLKNNHPQLYSQVGSQSPSKKDTPPQPKKKSPKVPQSPPVDLLTDDDSSDGSSGPQNFYSVRERKKLKDAVKDYFSTVVIEDGKACMTQNKTLLKYVNKHKLLGFGSFGNVYGVTIPKTKPSISVAIKEGRLSSSELRRAMVKQYPIEYLFNKLINDLIDGKLCPNFSYTFAIFFCDKCTLNEFDKKPIQTQCSETVVELFDFTLDKLTDFRDEVILSILFQILFAVAAIQLEYGMFHNDIKKENILVKVIPSGGYWEYNLNGEKYCVPNHGYFVALNDFGVSLAFSPKIGNKDYGRRQAKVVQDYTNNTFYFEPFTTKFYPSISKTGVVTAIKSHSLGGKGLTWNHFYKNFDSKPSIPVELEDMSLFPVHHFHYDVLDTIYTFIGGKRTLQPGKHYAMKVSKNIHSLLKDFYLVKANQVWPTDRVDLFLAKHTIMKLFPFYLNSTLSGPLIDVYYL
jgi:hypothetical protein